MQNVNVIWCGIFVDAYKYSTNYLIFSIAVIFVSTLWVWIYEKPQFYKLLFKNRKNSNVLSPIRSHDELGNEQPVWDQGEISTAAMEKLQE